MTSFRDPTGRGPSAAKLALRGTIYLTVVATVAVLLLAQASGAFHRFVRATAVVATVGDGLDRGADVKMRGVLVGKVGPIESKPGGGHHVVHLLIEPDHARMIPASVTARIIPTNIFGQPSIELLPGKGDAAPLADGAVIPGDRSQSTLQLQTAINNLQRLITAVEPSKLNATLTNVRRALDGRCERIGGMIDRLDHYLGSLNDHSDAFGELIASTATALEGLQASAPDLLDTVDDVLVTSRTIVDKRERFAATFAGGGALIDTVDTFTRHNEQRIITLVENTRPLVHTLAAEADSIPRSFRDLGKGVEALVGVFDEDTGHLGIGFSFSLSPYDPYTAADCPRYPGLPGQNCGDARRSRSSAATDDEPVLGGTAGPVGSARELAQIGELLGTDSADSAALGSLLLGPLVRGTTVVIHR